MKRFYFILVAALMLVAGCGKEEGPTITPNDPTDEPNNPTTEEVTIALTERQQMAEVEGNTTQATIEFEVDVEWELVFRSYNNESIDWISANKTSGKAGKHTIELSMEPNSTPDNRLVNIEIHSIAQKQATRVQDYDIDDMVNSFQGVCFVVSLLQNRYYADKYPIGVRVNLNMGYTLKELIDEYVAEKNITYDDIEYLEVRGSLGGTTHVDSNYDFINKRLLNLKELDLRHADMTEIPVGAFMENRSIHYITLPKMLKSIGDNAFLNSELRNINLKIPPMVEYIGLNAFAGTQIGGSIIISTNSGYINIMQHAFNTPYIFTAIFGEGMHTIEGGKDSFQPALSFMVLPSTLSAIRHWYLRHVTIICCYATTPPQILDPILLQPERVSAVLVPTGSYLFYTDPYEPWSLLPVIPAL